MPFELKNAKMNVCDIPATDNEYNFIKNARYTIAKWYGPMLNIPLKWYI